MLKKTITFQDLDGNEITEDFYFNLSKAEIAEMEVSFEGGLLSHLKRIIADQNGSAIIASFKEIILKSVGRRSEDGRRFIKSQEIIDEFMQTDAYSVLFMEVATDAEASAAFVRGLMPHDLVQRSEQRSATVIDLPRNTQQVPKLSPSHIESIEKASSTREAVEAELRAKRPKSVADLTKEELDNLSRDELMRMLVEERDGSRRPGDLL